MSQKLMLWEAIYKDNMTLKEDVNEFNDIDRDKLKYFILEGLQTKFIHDVETGQTYINENGILFLLNDKLIGKSNDIINYKEKIRTINKPSTLNNDILGYYTGWKEKNDDFENIELLYWVDMLNQELKLRLTLTPKHENVLNSTFSIIINGIIKTVELKFPNIHKRERFIFELFTNS